jgi:hypothetical protein
MFDNIAVIIILSLAGIFIVRRIFKTIIKNEPGCGCGCNENCPGCSGAGLKTSCSDADENRVDKESRL